MKKVYLLALAACVLNAPAFAQKKTEHRVRTPYGKFRPAVLEQLLTQGAPGTAAKTTESAQRLKAQQFSEEFFTDSSALFYSGTNGSELDFMSGKGYFEFLEFQEADVPMMLQASARRKYNMCDSSVSFSTSFFGNTIVGSAYLYNAEKLVSRRTMTELDSDGTPTGTVRKDSVIYNAAGNPASADYLVTTGGTVDEGRAAYYFYDAAGWLVKDSFTEHVGPTYMPLRKVSYANNAAGQAITIIIEEYDDMTGTWEMASHVVRSFDGAGRLLTVKDLDEDEVPVYIDSFVYGAAAFPIKYISLSGTDADNYDQTLFFLNAAGDKVDSSRSQYFDAEAGMPVNYERNAFHWNTYGNIDSITVESLDEETGAVIDESAFRWYYELYDNGVRIEVAASLKAAVAPNPFSNTIVVCVDRPCTYAVYNLQGKVIATGSLQQQEAIEAADWAQGMYFITLIDAEGRSSVLKIVKQ